MTTYKISKAIRKRQRKTLLKLFADRRNIAKLIDRYHKTKKQGKKITKANDLLIHAVTHIAHKYGLYLSYHGTIDPIHYEAQLKNTYGDDVGLSFTLSIPDEKPKNGDVKHE